MLTGTLFGEPLSPVSDAVFHGEQGVRSGISPCFALLSGDQQRESGLVEA